MRRALGLSVWALAPACNEPPPADSSPSANATTLASVSAPAPAASAPLPWPPPLSTASATTWDPKLEEELRSADFESALELLRPKMGMERLDRTFAALPTRIPPGAELLERWLLEHPAPRELTRGVDFRARGEVPRHQGQVVCLDADTTKLPRAATDGVRSLVAPIDAEPLQLSEASGGSGALLHLRAIGEVPRTRQARFCGVHTGEVLTDEHHAWKIVGRFVAR